MKHHWAQPSFFLKVAHPLLPIAGVLTAIFFITGLYTSLVSSPPDYLQGDCMRIMYVHVPASWMALGV